MPAKGTSPRGRGPRRKPVATRTPTAARTPGVAGPALDLTEARTRLSESVNRVRYRGERIVIQRHRRPVALSHPSRTWP